MRKAPRYAESGGEAASESDDEDMWEPATEVSSSTGVPPPGTVVFNLIDSDEDPDGYALLSPDPTRRGGLYIAPSRVRIEQGPLAGNPLREPGLFTADAIRAGAFVAMYTGTFRSSIELSACRPTDATSCRATPWRWTLTMS